MLPPAHRMRHSADFSAAVRRGARARAGGLVVHRHRDDAAAARPALVGLVVSRAVGGSVARHRVARRLRHLMSARLDRLTPGTAVVIRALPAAAGESSDELARDLDHSLDRLAGRDAARDGGRDAGVGTGR